jgi:hypothetical protein
MNCTASKHGPADGITWLTARSKYKCRCPEALLAARRHQKRLRLSQLRGEPRMVSSSGAVLRLRALQGIGHSMRDLSLMLGYADRGALGQLIYGTRARITVGRHQRIKELYDRLWNTPGTSLRSVNRARSMGWPLPLDLDDDLIDDPDYQPTDNRLDEVTARRQEKEMLEERIRELEGRGMSAREISEALGVSSRLVTRRRAASRAAA